MMQLNPEVFPGSFSSGCLNSFNNQAPLAPFKSYYGPFYQQDMPSYNIDTTMLNQFNQMNLGYDYPVGDRNQSLPSQAKPQEVSHQEFDYFLVIDFEATCDKDKIPDPQEIIEFPCVIVNGVTGQSEGYFQTYVRPSYHLQLTDFCKKLTGIQQSQVDNGVSLSDALIMHDEWLETNGIKHKKFAVVTWSDWDCRVMLESECNFKNINKPTYFNRWINLKNPFREVSKCAHFNLQDAMKIAGLAWEGCAHSGLDDARNTARLLAFLMKGGYKFSITGKISEYPMDHLRPSKDKSKEAAAIDVKVPKPCLTSKSEHKCFCGRICMLHVVQEPGPTLGKRFYGCGKWNGTRRLVCNYRVWVK